MIHVNIHESRSRPAPALVYERNDPRSNHLMNSFLLLVHLCLRLVIQRLPDISLSRGYHMCCLVSSRIVHICFQWNRSVSVINLSVRSRPRPTSVRAQMIDPPSSIVTRPTVSATTTLRACELLFRLPSDLSSGCCVVEHHARRIPVG